MNKLPKDKRDKLILTCLVVVGLCGLLYTFVLAAQKDRLGVLQRQILTMRDKVSKAERLLNSAKIIENNLQENRKVLGQRESLMAPQGQYYYWFYKQVEQFCLEEKLNTGFVVDISQPEFSEAGLLPEFPYKAATFGIRLNGAFQEVGRFVADLENLFPYFRIQSLKMAPLSGRGALSTQFESAAANTGATDRLVVELRVVTLIRGGTT